ncbi:mycoredoxin [Rarobacter faecitabidus]|uniref:Mycoredoxin n=1 Tax=Rarobacter faecitabidus TaxID=13243 RepID=A0A542ZUB2_RARFA|nr:glutaredoxin domain-containing protein [Rarobacter faecitabidus]TQL63944.1 mycoredoxin [Rarobacter faecitabidus]
MPQAPQSPAPGSIVMLSTGWCGYCKRLKTQLSSAGIPVTEIDIETDPSFIEFIESVNDGNRTVPTVVYPDGTAATNPTLNQVKSALGI